MRNKFDNIFPKLRETILEVISVLNKESFIEETQDDYCKTNFKEIIQNLYFHNPSETIIFLQKQLLVKISLN